MRVLGESGIKVFPLGLDGGAFGWISGAATTTAILDRFLESGGNLISTADHYAGGRSEVMIGQWLETVPDRGRLVISAIVGQHPDAAGLSPKSLVSATEAALVRLRTDYIDILTLDGANVDAAIDDTLETVDMLRRSGKVRAIAVTGHTAARVRAMLRRAGEAAYPRVEAIAHEYSLVRRTVLERELAPLAVEEGVGLFARHPLGEGFLSGNFAEDDGQPDSAWRLRALTHASRQGSRILEALGEIAEEHGVSRSRVAAAWAISRPGVTAALVSATNADEVADVLAARELTLTRQQLAQLDKVSE